MPGIGFAVGGLIAALVSPRMTFLAAGSGVIAVVVVMAPILGANWLERGKSSDATSLDGHDDVVVELIPGAISGNPTTEEGP
jgi:hypothetical protein